jgi:hypothetical protein
LNYHISYSRPEVYKVEQKVIDLDDGPLSDYVIVRLAVARAKAMQKYREIYSEGINTVNEFCNKNSTHLYTGNKTC